MAVLISERKPVARKNHECMADEFLYAGFYDFKSCGGVIEKGEKYINQTMKGDNIYTFKAHINCHEFCLEEGLYNE